MPPETAHDDAARQQLRELKRRRQLNALALEVANQEHELRSRGLRPSVSLSRESGTALEDFADPDSLFGNAADYIGEVGYGYGPGQQTPWLSTRSDREEGRNRPMFATENELAAIRGAARLLHEYNPNAKGIIKHLTNFTLSKGFAYKFAMIDGNADQALAKHCQRVVDRFITDNAFVGDQDKENFRRGHRDGESFYGLWHVGHGRVEGRAIEPEQVTEPGAPRDIEDWLDRAGNDRWSFGIHTDGDDTENVRGIYAQWSNNAQDWSYLPAGKHPCLPPSPEANAWVEHYKCNVDRKIKRGLSDFFCPQTVLEAARKLLRNMGSGASIQAAIAWIIETAAGTLPSTVQNLTMGQSAGPYSQQTQKGTRTNQTAKYDPGTVLYTAHGTQYKPAPLGSDNAPNFVLVYEAILRSAAVMWCMPDHMVTGSADEVNYAAILETGSPFVRAIESEQVTVALSHERIMWKVVEFACSCGEIPCDYETVRRLVRLAVKPPRVAVRDRLKDVQADNILYAAGAMSAATMAANDGLDYQEEEDQGAEPHFAKGKAAETPVDPNAAAAQAADTTESIDEEASGVRRRASGSTGASSLLADQRRGTGTLLEYNENHDNKGEFSSSPGSGGAGPRASKKKPASAAKTAAKKPSGVKQHAPPAAAPRDIRNRDVEVDNGATQHLGTWVYRDVENEPYDQQVHLVSGRWYDPDNEDAEPVAVHRWESSQEGSTTDNGDWTTDKSQAAREGRNYVRDNDADGEHGLGDHEAARTLPKPADVKASGKSTAKVEAIGREESEIAGMAKQSYGLDLQGVSSVIGAPDGATVEVKASALPGHESQLRATVKHPAIEQCRRTLSVDGDGKKFIHNDILVLKDEYMKSGAGSDIFAREVEQAQKSGFSYIETHAARTGGYNGYYTWPRLGYDQPLEELDRGVAAAAQREFPGAKSVLDVMSTKEGRDWWKEHGDDMTEARFDLTPGSRSLKVHAAYMAQKAKAQAA